MALFFKFMYSLTYVNEFIEYHLSSLYIYYIFSSFSFFSLFFSILVSFPCSNSVMLMLADDTVIY